MFNHPWVMTKLSRLHVTCSTSTHRALCRIYAARRNGHRAAARWNEQSRQFQLRGEINLKHSRYVREHGESEQQESSGVAVVIPGATAIVPNVVGQFSTAG